MKEEYYNFRFTNRRNHEKNSPDTEHDSDDAQPVFLHY